MKIKQSERGQAIVMIMLALVGLFAFAGLAIDGGRMWSERRRAQNAADSAAFAAAMAALENGNPVAAALSQAALNDFFDEDGQANPGARVDVMVNHPPVEGQFAGNEEYYEVIIRGFVESTFARLIMVEQLPVEAHAVTRARVSSSLSGNNAVLALNTSGNGIEFKGNISVSVTGGSMMSDSAIDKKGGSGDITVTDGGIYYILGDTAGWLGTVSPAPQKVANPVKAPSVPDPDCGSTVQSAPISNQGKLVYQPGIYPDKVVINAHDNVTFLPGIYCFMDGLHDNGNSVMQGDGVFFVLKGGDLQFNGNSEINLMRSNNLVDGAGNQWGGMLLYVPGSNQDAVIDITGNNESTFSGTIFAPEGYCRIGGTTKDLGLNTNLICLDILFHGTPDVVITYNEPENYRAAPMIELTE